MKASKLPLQTEVKLTFMTASGPGGQNVNKVATAVHLRFNVVNSSALPDDIKQRLISFLGKRLTGDGDLIIKASCFRTQERNKQDAMQRLYELIDRVFLPPKKRKKTKPTYASKQKRLKTKKFTSDKKVLRRSV